jgi:hypothetical protein
VSTIEGVRVTIFADEAAASDAARKLVERGIGTEVVEVAHGVPANLLTGERTSRAFALEVLEVDLDRACAVLGVPLPEPEARSEPDVTPDGRPIHSWFGGRLRLTTRQVVAGAVVYLVLLIAIPFGVVKVTEWLTEPAVHQPATGSNLAPVSTVYPTIPPVPPSVGGNPSPQGSDTTPRSRGPSS